MSELTALTEALGYHESENWVPLEGHLSATLTPSQRGGHIGVAGMYVYQTSAPSNQILSNKPVVVVASAKSLDECRLIHRNIWNQGLAPFLIIVLPGQVRVYSSFSFDKENHDKSLIATSISNIKVIKKALKDFHAHEIDSGRIWSSASSHINIDSRIDQHLLRNLKSLGEYLIQKAELLPAVAHSLIGKFIYIRYLLDRSIISDEWFNRVGISKENILGRNAKASELKKLVKILEERFNGQIFPFQFSGKHAPNDLAVAAVASAFKGDDISSGQMALDFDIYDFSLIPIEILSSIYEQFLHVEGKGRDVGAFYTPEPLADYLLAEINSISALKIGMKVFDPCCGSGVFLVLAYRRLINLKIKSQNGERLRPAELRDILESFIFGVERNQEACFVTQFSLILTLLSYVDPPDLQRYPTFRFPSLHNNNILNLDFFDDEGCRQATFPKFDWIIGNPPWLELSPTGPEKLAIKWIVENIQNKPVGRYKVCEAFAWRATEFLSEIGTVGFVIHATSLTNNHSKRFREHFFKNNRVFRVTNFSNLAYVLFDKRAEVPAATIIYSPTDGKQSEAVDTLHYGPFVANQLPIRDIKNRKSFSIVQYEDEISTIPNLKTTSGDSLTWKMALWGNIRHSHNLARLSRHFPNTLSSFVEKKNWSLCLGVQMRGGKSGSYRSGEKSLLIPELANKKLLMAQKMSDSGKRLTVPNDVLQKIPNGENRIRTRGGRNGLEILHAPHIVIGPNFAAYSDQDFVLPHPQIGLSAPKKDKALVKALSVYLNSSISKYLLFFSSTSWGIDRSIVGLGDVERLPIPEISESTVQFLSDAYNRFAEMETAIFHSSINIQGEIDKVIKEAFSIPDQTTVLANDFLNFRLPFIKGKIPKELVTRSDKIQIELYLDSLIKHLKAFSGIEHEFELSIGHQFVAYRLYPAGSKKKTAFYGLEIKDLNNIWDALYSRHSQWVYTQSSLRIFENNSIVVVKPSRVVEWTLSSAIKDADDIIAEVIHSEGVDNTTHRS